MIFADQSHHHVMLTSLTINWLNIVYYIVFTFFNNQAKIKLKKINWYSNISSKLFFYIVLYKAWTFTFCMWLIKKE
jgi:hypothetical protein